MEEIKSVRIRRVFEGSSLIQLGTGSAGLSGAQFDIKVTIYKERRKRSLIGFNQSGSKIWDKIEYSDNGRYSDFNDDDLIKDFINVNSKRENANFEIIQDPYLDKPPKERSFGFDPYYLNNGSKILISWFDNNSRVGGKSWSDLDGNELKIQKGQTQSTKSSITKTAEVFYSSEENKILKLTSMGLESNTDSILNEFSGTVDDKDIIETILYQWKRQVPNYNSLDLCEPNNEFCELIDFIDPTEELEESEPEEDNKLVSEDPIADDKIKLSFEIDTNLKIKPREDFSFKLFIGEPPEDPNLAGFDFGEDEQDLSLLGEEFTEADFDGLPESEFLLQNDIANNQEDYDSGQITPLSDKVSIPLSKNLDSLLRSAGQNARILGLNSKVNYENLRSGYIKGIHGLCPQGTRAVLVALTGIKELGSIKGNADWFSFKEPATGGMPWKKGLGFDKPINGKSYYNEKVRISQINGSWKGTYLQSSNQWQVGDIIACGYVNGKKYGHIQIWTGYAWLSDFKQNAIQQRNVDPNTVALWRLNENGLNIIKQNDISDTSKGLLEGFRSGSRSFFS